MQIKSYCETCGDRRRPGVSYVFKLRAGPVTLDIADLPIESCGSCGTHSVPLEVLGAVVRELIKELSAARPAMPRPTLQIIAAKVAAQLGAGGLLDDTSRAS